jgi:hypothetical protein
LKILFLFNQICFWIVAQNLYLFRKLKLWLFKSYLHGTKDNTLGWASTSSKLWQFFVDFFYLKVPIKRGLVLKISKLKHKESFVNVGSNCFYSEPSNTGHPKTEIIQKLKYWSPKFKTFNFLKKEQFFSGNLVVSKISHLSVLDHLRARLVQYSDIHCILSFWNFRKVFK